ncbi:APC family permease [Gluconobacter aidae]|uniref:Amino acid permease n=1 Tax=Gluconobacter aidae TaxID=2662454 RepID=A0A7X1SSN2_9PROT|nr:amino acid permease [Gluconobacter aidae]MQR99285.1 amino acid permease [Gluconobacter aidae]
MSGSHLRQSIRMRHIVAIGVGSSLGVSIFGVLGPAASIAGPALLVSLVIAAVPMGLFAFLYAYLSSVSPASGASFVWPTRFLGARMGFAIAWLRIVGSVAAIVQHGAVLARYVVPVLPVHLSDRSLMIGLFSVLYLANIRGAGNAARVQAWLTTGLVVLLSLFALLACRHMTVGHFQPFAPQGFHGVLLAVPVLVGLFTGIEFAAEMGEEIRNVGRVIAPGLAIAIAIVLGVYVVVALTTIGVEGAALATSRAPLLDAARVFLGDKAGFFIGLAATISIVTSLNGVFLIFSRFLFAMGRSGVLPASLGTIHPRWQTPHVAMTVVFVLSIIGAFLPNDLLFLFLAVNIPTMLKYATNSVCAIRAARSGMMSNVQSGFRPRPQTVSVVGTLAIVSALLIAILGTVSDWRPYAVLAVWGLVGMIVWRFRRRIPQV